MNGKDATSAFNRAGHSQYAKSLMRSMIIGTLGKKSAAPEKASLSQAAARPVTAVVDPGPKRLLEPAPPAPPVPVEVTPGFSTGFSPFSYGRTSPASSSRPKLAEPSFLPRSTSPIPPPPPAAPSPASSPFYMPVSSDSTSRSSSSSPATARDALTAPPPASAAADATAARPGCFPATPAEVEALGAARPSPTTFSFSRPFHVDPSLITRPGRPGPAEAGDALDAMLPDLADLTARVGSSRVSSGLFGGGGDPSYTNPGCRMAIRSYFVMLQRNALQKFQMPALVIQVGTQLVVRSLFREPKLLRAHDRSRGIKPTLHVEVPQPPLVREPPTSRLPPVYPNFPPFSTIHHSDHALRVRALRAHFALCAIFCLSHLHHPSPHHLHSLCG